MGVSSSKSQSQLAKEAAPPKQGMPTLTTAAFITAIIIVPFVGIWTLIEGWGMTFFVAMSLGLGLPFFVVAFFVIALLPKSRLQKHLEEQDSSRRSHYERSYVCMVCGSEFETRHA
jgi:fatty acid desaturase